MVIFDTLNNYPLVKVHIKFFFSYLYRDRVSTNFFGETSTQTLFYTLCFFNKYFLTLIEEYKINSNLIQHI